MGLEKAIEHGKEHRKKWSFAKSVDKRCRNHGGCEWCLGNRTHKNKRRMEEADYEDFNATKELSNEDNYNRHR